MDVSRPQEGASHGKIMECCLTSQGDHQAPTLLCYQLELALLGSKEWTQAAQAVRPGDLTSQIALESGLSRTGPAYILHDPLSGLQH